MNKSELAANLGLGLGTVSRYQGMGMPFEKIGGRYSFNLHDCTSWITGNIDSREPCEDYLPKMTPKQAVENLHRMALFFLEHSDQNLVNRHLEGKCPLHHR